MELEQLDSQERLVLVAALRLTVLADGRATEGEARELDTVVGSMGQANYDAAFEQADREIRDLGELDSKLATVTREEARELIYGTVLTVTLADSTGVAEEPVLERMARAWNLRVEVAAPPGDRSAEDPVG